MVKQASEPAPEWLLNAEATLACSSPDTPNVTLALALAPILTLTLALTLTLTQAVSSVIRALAGKEIDVHSRPAGWVVAKESAVGALCGLVLGAFVLVVGVCCRVVTFHVSYRLEHG